MADCLHCFGPEEGEVTTVGREGTKGIHFSLPGGWEAERNRGRRMGQNVVSKDTPIEPLPLIAPTARTFNPSQ